jgi:hypothetical protein
MRRKLYIGAAFLALFIALGIRSAVLEKRAAVEAAGIQAPMFEADPSWPKPLPNHWILGVAIGVCIDAQNHVWIIHRDNSPDCCMISPPLLEFDQAGNLIGHWGGPGKGYD